MTTTCNQCSQPIDADDLDGQISGLCSETCEAEWSNENSWECDDCGKVDNSWNCSSGCDCE